MPHRAVARFVVRAELAVESAVARVSPVAARWLHRHHAWVYRPVHLIALGAMLWWGAMLWFVLPDAALASNNYRVLRYFNLDLEGVLMMVDGLVLFISPRWWLSHRFGRAWPLIPSFAMILAGAVLFGVALTITYSALLSGTGALIGSTAVTGAVIIAVGIGDACEIARLTSERAADEVRHVVRAA